MFLWRLRRTEIPQFGPIGHGLGVRGPIMKRGRVEIRAIGPHQRMHFGIDPHLIEHRQLPQWPEKLAGEHQFEVDHLFGVILKPNA